MRDDNEWVVFCIVFIAHIATVPALLQLLRWRWMYEAIVSCFMMLTSFCYHTCQAFHTSFFLEEIQWHRLDNLTALTCFGMLFTHMANFKEPIVSEAVKYSTLMIAILCQEKDPWNEKYTFIPVALFLMLPVVSHVASKKLPFYDWKSFAIGGGALLCAVPFFVLGLDDDHDPFRFFHSMWHFMIAISSLLLWRVVKRPFGKPLPDFFGD